MLGVQVTTLEGRVVWSVAMGAKHGVRPFRRAGATGSALDDAGFGSLGWLAAIPLRQPNPFGSMHASMLACGGKMQLQPTRVAARMPMRSVLMLIPHIRGLSSARTSCGDLNVALVVYHLRKSIKWLLIVRRSPRQAAA